MAAHLNITSTQGITLGTGAEADDVQKIESVELDELPDQETGEFIKVAGIGHKKVAVTVSGDGPFDLSGVAVGTVADPSTMTVTSADVSEAPNKRCSFSITASGDEAFADPGGSGADAGAEPSIADLKITSVSYAVAESVRRSYAVDDMVLVGTDGEPFARAKVGLKGSFSISGRGDLPAGTALGSGGAAFKGGGTGVIMVSSLMTGEKRKDWNRWSCDGGHYKSAA